MDDGDYADTRHTRKKLPFEELPIRESIRQSNKVYNGKLDLGPLVRFLRAQVGRDWDEVYSEILQRIPTELLQYRFVISWYVADCVEIVDGKILNRKTRRWLYVNMEGEWRPGYEGTEFYVHPETNLLTYVPDLPSRRATKQLTLAALRKFREEEKRKIRLREGFRRARRAGKKRAAMEVLRNRRRGTEGRMEIPR